MLAKRKSYSLITSSEKTDERKNQIGQISSEGFNIIMNH